MSEPRRDRAAARQLSRTQRQWGPRASGARLGRGGAAERARAARRGGPRLSVARDDEMRGVIVTPAGFLFLNSGVRFHRPRRQVCKSSSRVPSRHGAARKRSVPAVQKRRQHSPFRCSARAAGQLSRPTAASPAAANPDPAERFYLTVFPCPRRPSPLPSPRRGKARGGELKAKAPRLPPTRGSCRAAKQRD